MQSLWLRRFSATFTLCICVLGKKRVTQSSHPIPVVREYAASTSTGVTDNLFIRLPPNLFTYQHHLLLLWLTRLPSFSSTSKMLSHSLLMLVGLMACVLLMYASGCCYLCRWHHIGNCLRKVLSWPAERLRLRMQFAWLLIRFQDSLSYDFRFLPDGSCICPTLLLMPDCMQDIHANVQTFDEKEALIFMKITEWWQDGCGFR